MSESHENVAEPNAEQNRQGRRKRRNRLMQRAVRERWPISKSLRASAMKCLHQIIDDTSVEPRDCTSAVRAALAASRLNHENVTVTIKASRHLDLERKLKEIQAWVEKRKANPNDQRSWTGPGQQGAGKQ